MTSYSIAVVGAGITGLTTAYFLASHGHRVTVYDKHSGPAMQTSYANGGQLSVSNAEVWTTWSTLKKGAKWMFKQDAPLLFSPKPSWAKMKWGAGFVWDTMQGRFYENTKSTVELGLRAREIYFRIASEEGFEFGLLKKGILHFYRSEEAMDAGVKSCELFRKLGVYRYPVSARKVVEIEPALRHAKTGIVGGTYTPGDASGDIHAFCSNLAKVLEKKYSVKFEYSSTVTEIDHEPDGVLLSIKTEMLQFSNPNSKYTEHCDYAVVCAGVDSPSLMRTIGESINVYPVKGYSITVGLKDEEMADAPIVSLLDEETKIVASRVAPNKFRVAGTAELADWNYDIRADRIKPLVDWVRTNLPHVGIDDVSPWAGLRPMTPSMLPIVRRSKKSPRIVLNTGHGHLGWTLAPATAEKVANELIG